MLLRISVRGDSSRPATDLGYVLAKNPFSLLKPFSVPFGQARVFFPQAREDFCSCALYIEMDPIGVVRSASPSLDEYVNDRPFVFGSFGAVAMSKVFSSAINGKCGDRPELVEAEWDFEVSVAAIRSPRGVSFVHDLFAPFGWTVACRNWQYEGAYLPETQDSAYQTLTLVGRSTIKRLLQALYVLLPVLDGSKHYDVEDAEVLKLLKHGSEWLPTHPERRRIVSRYLGHRPELRKKADAALEALLPPQDELEEQIVVDAGPSPDAEVERGGLNGKRIKAVSAQVMKFNPLSVLDIGCGSGRLLETFIGEVPTLIGLEIDAVQRDRAGRWMSKKRRAVAKAREIDIDTLPKVEIIAGSVTLRNPALKDIDVVTLVEVIEHVEPWELPRLEANIFGHIRPRAVVVTTPNRLYNVQYGLEEGELRHHDHRFEWTSGEFFAWATRVAKDYGYEWTSSSGIGDHAEDLGYPTNMVVLERRTEKPLIEVPEIPEVSEVLGPREIHAMGVPIKLSKERSLAALYELTKHPVDVRFLIYIPPTMSPVEAANGEDFCEYLERPEQAFDYFGYRGIKEVVVETKHMGSRAVVIVGQNEEAIERSFGVPNSLGTIYSRTGKRMLDPDREQEVLRRVRDDLNKASFFERYGTGWVALDCEIMPWNLAGGGGLVRRFANVQVAANAALSLAMNEANLHLHRQVKVSDEAFAAADDLRYVILNRQRAIESYGRAFQHYCWSCQDIDAIKIAPFHILGSDFRLWDDMDHIAHMEILNGCAGDVLQATEYHLVRLGTDDENFIITRWLDLTEAGGEGMVFKARNWHYMEQEVPPQPALKVRGREYLRIIYGPFYLEPHNMSRLRSRNTKSKRWLARQEYLLGLEGIRRFARGESDARVFECVVGVLGLEAETIDPRL